MGFLTKKRSGSTPLIIIKKNADLSRLRDDANLKEYNSIEEAIADLENDPNVPSVKIEKLKSSLKNLKNKTSITIRNGEIIK
jgi:hypothetical protein